MSLNDFTNHERGLNSQLKTKDLHNLKFSTILNISTKTTSQKFKFQIHSKPRQLYIKVYCSNWKQFSTLLICFSCYNLKNAPQFFCFGNWLNSFDCFWTCTTFWYWFSTPLSFFFFGVCAYIAFNNLVVSGSSLIWTIVWFAKCCCKDFSSITTNKAYSSNMNSVLIVLAIENS